MERTTVDNLITDGGIPMTVAQNVRKIKAPAYKPKWIKPNFEN